MKVKTEIELTWKDIAKCVSKQLQEEGYVADENSMKYRVAEKTYEGIIITINASRNEHYLNQNKDE